MWWYEWHYGHSLEQTCIACSGFTTPEWCWSPYTSGCGICSRLSGILISALPWHFASCLCHLPIKDHYIWDLLGFLRWALLIITGTWIHALPQLTNRSVSRCRMDMVLTLINLSMQIIECKSSWQNIFFLGMQRRWCWTRTPSHTLNCCCICGFWC